MTVPERAKALKQKVGLWLCGVSEFVYIGKLEYLFFLLFKNLNLPEIFDLNRQFSVKNYEQRVGRNGPLIR